MEKLILMKKPNKITYMIKMSMFNFQTCLILW
jgi:hypothetical protein